MQAKPGCRDEVAAALLGGLAGLRAAGCTLYLVDLSDTDNDAIRVSEVWR